MSMIATPAFWFVLVLSIGLPLFFITSVQYVTYRLVSHRHSPQMSRAENFVFPPFHFTSAWHLIRTLILVGVLGVGTGVILLRFALGIGAATHLSDQFPWGIWIGFDVMSGVALAAGGFVMAATVHIFNIERFKPLVRPAILTGLLGYLLVVGGLMVDLGRPYNVWRPLIHWQHHSVMWEVGLCVATYTTVLFIEFLPVILEKVNSFSFITNRLPTVAFYNLLKKVSIVFVILGVVLSTLHQSSLGSLWVLMPTKVYPLWYSLYLPVFFWLSAVAVGFAMTIVESTLSSKAFNRGLETHLLADLAKAAAVVLSIYLAAKAVDLVRLGAWPLLFEPNLQSVSFWVEMGLGVIVPIILFSIKPLRHNHKVLFSGAMMVVIFGIVLNRLNVSWIGLLPYAGNIYFPSWMEIIVSVTIVSFGIIAFGMAAKYLPVFPEETSPDH